MVEFPPEGFGLSHASRAHMCDRGLSVRPGPHTQCFFVQVSPPPIYLTRHGQSRWNLDGKNADLVPLVGFVRIETEIAQRTAAVRPYADSK